VTTPLLKPDLYAACDGGDPPILLGGRCTCGHVFFPMQTYGCERCGATGSALAPAPLKGRGRLVATATVHLHADPARPAPFVVGTIALDDGPVVRTLIIDTKPEERRPGARVEAVLIAVARDDGTEALDLRFRPERAS
jgi:uncharacterized OB-fold protein